MALGLRWSGSGAFFATEIRVQFHEWLAIVTGTLTPGALIVFVAILAADLLPVTLVGALVYSMFLIGQRVLNEAAYVRIDHKLNELYHASSLSPEGYFVGIAGGMLVAYLPPSLVLLGILQILHPLDAVAGLTLIVCLLAVWAVSSTIGYVVSTLFKDMKTIWPYSALLTNLFGVVPPVFYRLGSVPVGWRSVALLLPTSAAAVLVDAAAGLESLTRTEATVAAIALAGEALVLFAFGIYFSNLLPAMPAIVVLGIILSMVTAVSLFGWIVLIACILTIWILYSAIGIAVSSRLRSQREVWPVGNLIFTLLGILSPLYYPISRLPSGWGEIARLLPATYAALLVQGALGLERSTNFAVDGGLLMLSAAVGLVAAWWLYEWRER